MRYEPSHDSTPAPGAGPADRPGRPRRRALRRTTGAFAALGVAALVAAGCGSSGTKSTTAATAAPAASATTASPAAPAAAGTTVTATETEYKITLSSMTFKAGTYTFHTVNAGKIDHALEITGPGVGDVMTPGIKPGQSADLTVTLQGGNYDVFCPVPGHKQLGMNMEITVTGGSVAVAPAATTPTTAPSGGSVGY
jgi:uncharacterized cupredoxin-like copper-binding protein